MKIFIDENCKCHVSNPKEEYKTVETDFFDGMCNVFIEGHCVELDINGIIQKIYPWKDRSELDSAQREYERNQIAEYETALSEIETALGVTE